MDMRHPLEGMRSMGLVSGMLKTVLETEKILVLQAQLGEWDNLNHLIVCKKSNQAMIVDPFDGKYWLDICQERNWNLNQVWLTHSHWDHSKGIDELQSCDIWVHEKESERGWNGASNRTWTHEPLSFVIQKLGDLVFEIHCTPGHTPGHVTFVGEGVVISGDCIFLGRCGRTDLFGGDPLAQRKSLIYLRNRLSELNGDEIILPGHRYELADGSNPTFISISELLSNNEAILAIDDDSKWSKLPFLAFEDNLAEKARRQRAKNAR